jgi:hypothetical protein
MATDENQIPIAEPLPIDAVEDPGGIEELPDVQLAAIRDGVVSDRTRACYLKENFYFLIWLRTEQPTSMTAFGLNRITAMVSNAPVGTTDRQFFAHNRAAFDELTRGSDMAPIIDVDVLTPAIYMDYCRSLRNQRTRSYLGKSTMGVKRAALYHLYRLHNGSGYTHDFNLTLNNLFCGFYCVLTSRRTTITNTNVIGKNEVATTRCVALPRWNQVFIH